MRARHLIPLFWVVAFAITLPILAWFGAEAVSLQEQKERQLAMLERQQAQQAQLLRQLEQDAQFVNLVEVFVSEAQQRGLSGRGLTQYPVRFREQVEPGSTAAELTRLRAEPGRFYQPQNFFLGRAGLETGSNGTIDRRLEDLSSHRQGSYVMSYQGRALVVNDEI